MSLLTDPTLLAQDPSLYASLGAPAPLGVTSGGQPYNAGGSSMSSQLQTALANIEQAINTGNQRQYDLAVGQLLGVFNGQNTVEEQKLMGIGANGQPTLDALTQAEKQREADITAQGNLLDTGAKLTGPKDYGDFMAYTGGGQRLMQQLLNGRPSSSAPTGDMEPMDLYALLQKFGMGPGQTATSNPVGGPNFLRTGTPVTGSGGGGTDPTQPDNSQPLPTDASMFPTMANDADIAYAKAMAAKGNAYDPSGYQSFLQANGGTPDWTAPHTVTTPGTGHLQTSFSTAWGPWEPYSFNDTNNPTNNPSIRRLVLNQYLGNGGEGPGSGKTLYNGVNTNSLSDQQVASIVEDWASHQMTGGTGPTTTTVGTGEPSWFKDYMSTLIGLGPNVNRGAAENLPLLAQLGMANPTGLSQILNPAGNIDPAKWDKLGPLGQSLMQQVATKVYGWDPTEFQNQINATRPLGAPISGVQVGYTPLQLAA